jgi:hypothetical protein
MNNTNLDYFYSGIISNSPVSNTDDIILWNTIMYKTTNGITQAVDSPRLFLFYDLNESKLYIVDRQGGLKLYSTTNVLFDIINNVWVKFKSSSGSCGFSTIDEILCDCSDGGNGGNINPFSNVQCWTNLGTGTKNEFYGQSNYTTGNKNTVFGSYNYTEGEYNLLPGTVIQNSPTLNIRLELVSGSYRLLLDGNQSNLVSAQGYVIMKTELREYTVAYNRSSYISNTNVTRLILVKLQTCNDLPTEPIISVVFCSNYGNQVCGRNNIQDGAHYPIDDILYYSGFNRTLGTDNFNYGNFIESHGINNFNLQKLYIQYLNDQYIILNGITLANGTYNALYTGYSNPEWAPVVITKTDTGLSFSGDFSALTVQTVQIIDPYHITTDVSGVITSNIGLINEAVFLVGQNMRTYVAVKRGNNYILYRRSVYRELLVSLSQDVINNLLPTPELFADIYVRLDNIHIDMSGNYNRYNGNYITMMGNGNQPTGSNIFTHGNGNNVDSGYNNLIIGSGHLMKTRVNTLCVGDGYFTALGIPSNSISLAYNYGNANSQLYPVQNMVKINTLGRINAIISGQRLDSDIVINEAIPYFIDPVSSSSNNLIKNIGTDPIQAGFVDVPIQYVQFDYNQNSGTIDIPMLKVNPNTRYTIDVNFCGELFNPDNSIVGLKKYNMVTYQINFKTDYNSAIILESLNNNQCIFMYNTNNPALTNFIGAGPSLYMFVDQPELGFIAMGYMLLNYGNDLIENVNIRGAVELNILAYNIDIQQT